MSISSLHINVTLKDLVSSGKSFILLGIISVNGGKSLTCKIPNFPEFYTKILLSTFL
jgi:hypothetical protein